MPPLTEVRQLELPPLADEDVERLLSRNAGKYFVSARGAQLVGAAVTRRGRGMPMSVVAAAAPAALIAKIHAAAREAGWTVDDTGPAESAWAAAAIAMWSGFAKRTSRVLVAHHDRTDVLYLEEGRLAGVRRFRAGVAEASLVADATRESTGQEIPRVGAFGLAAPRAALLRALGARRITVELPVGTWADLADSPELVAAHFAGSPVGPVLRSAESRAVEQAAARRVAGLVATAAAVLVVAAGALELWGVRRELAVMRADRAKIKPDIASTFVGRGTIEAAYGHLATLGAVEHAAPRWSEVLTNVTAHLPDDAFFIGVRMRGDSIVMEGLAPHAARVFDALERTSELTQVRAGAPVRREVQEDKTALEHFTIAALVRVPEASASVAPASGKRAAARKGGQ